MGIFKKTDCKTIKALKKNALVGDSPQLIGFVAVNNLCKAQLAIGDHVIMRYNKFFCFGRGKLTIGKYTYLGDGTQIDAAKNVRIGDFCMISNRVQIQDHTSHPIAPMERRKQLLSLQKTPTSVYDTDIREVVIEDDVWIGMDALILKGVTIGRGSIVAAKAVVTKSIPPFSIAAGNPAKVVKKISEEDKKAFFEEIGRIGKC